MSIRSPSGTAIKVNGGNAAANTFIGMKIDVSLVGISVIGSSFNKFIANTFNAPASAPATTHISLGAGSTKNLFSQNQILGVTTTGILIAATANNNTVYPNRIDLVSGTPISDSGTGNLTAGITASGSACAITAMIDGIVTAATCTP